MYQEMQTNTLSSTLCFSCVFRVGAVGVRLTGVGLAGVPQCNCNSDQMWVNDIDKNLENAVLNTAGGIACGTMSITVSSVRSHECLLKIPKIYFGRVFRTVRRFECLYQYVRF